MLALPKDEAHVWFVPSRVMRVSSLAESYYSILSTDEIARARTYRSLKALENFVLGRALLRAVLSKYSTVRPEAWSFKLSVYGKPEIVAPNCVRPFQFSLTHTNGLVACAITDGYDIGLDVENAARKVSIEVAHRYFAPSEVKALQATPAERRATLVLEYWILKEAFVKAYGVGLSIPLDAICFEISGTSVNRVSFYDLAEDPVDWQFTLLRPALGYILALAIRRCAIRPLRVVVNSTIPLSSS